MITGNFFIPQFDLEDNGTPHVFRYNYLANEEKIDLQEKYPIYVVFKNNAIEFNFQGKIESNEDVFGHFPILKIPFGTEIHAENQEDISSIFHRKLALKIDQNYKPVNHNYPSNPVLNYSRLSVFDLADYMFEHTDDDTKFLRKLLLDFLDDFFNANVFKLSPSYQSTRTNILNSSILKGIYLKADFYLRRNHYCNGTEEIVNLKVGTFNDLKTNINKFIGSLKNGKSTKSDDALFKIKYLNALDIWIEFLYNKEHIQLFNCETGWFKFSDQEAMQAIKSLPKFNSRFNFCDFLKRKIAFTNFFFSGKIKEDKHENNVNNSAYKEQNLIKRIIKKTILSLIKDYEIAKATRILFIKSTLKYGWIFPLAILILLVFTCMVKGGLDEFGLFSFIIIAIVICTLAILLLSSNHFFKPAINLVLPRMMMAITTSWIAILSSVDYIKRGFLLSVSEALLYGSILLLITFIFLVQEIIRNTTITSPLKVIYKCFNVIIPGLVMSLAIGLLGMSLLTKSNLLSSDFFDSPVFRENVYEVKIHDNERKSYLDCVEELHLSLETTHPGRFVSDSLRAIYEEYKAKLKIEKYKDHEFVFNSLSSLHYLKSEKTAKGEKLSFSPDKVAYYYYFKGIRKFHIVLFPGLLILMSAFALFSGVFLTLLFDDKSVTEPL